jgi:hypothetical protein
MLIYSNSSDDKEVKLGASLPLVYTSGMMTPSALEVL